MSSFSIKSIMGASDTQSDRSKERRKKDQCHGSQGQWELSGQGRQCVRGNSKTRKRKEEQEKEGEGRKTRSCYTGKSCVKGIEKKKLDNRAPEVRGDKGADGHEQQTAWYVQGGQWFQTSEERERHTHEDMSRRVGTRAEKGGVRGRKSGDLRRETKLPGAIIAQYAQRQRDTDIHDTIRNRHCQARFQEPFLILMFLLSPSALVLFSSSAPFDNSFLLFFFHSPA